MQCAASLCNYLLRFCAQSVLASEELHLIRRFCQNTSGIILFYCILYIVINNCQHHPTLVNPMAHNQNVVCGSKVQLDLLVDC